MQDPVDVQLHRMGLVATRRQLFRVATRGRVDHLMRSGQLVTPFRRALCRPWDADVPGVRRRAALVSVGPPATLSHLTALEMWGLVERTPDAPIHVTTPATRAPRGEPGLVVHRTRRFPDVTRLGALIVTTAPDAVVSSWPLLATADRRGPAIRAIHGRTTSPGQLRESLQRYPDLADRRQLAELIALLEAGCESELEIWGHTRVFDVAGLRHGVRQRVLRAGGRSYRLDLGYDAERVAVEMDGWAFHSSREQRERDIRRDADLAGLGWLTVRFTHRRLTTDVEGCRQQLRAILASRSGREP